MLWIYLAHVCVTVILAVMCGGSCLDKKHSVYSTVYWFNESRVVYLIGGKHI